MLIRFYFVFCCIYFGEDILTGIFCVKPIEKRLFKPFQICIPIPKYIVFESKSLCNFDGL